MVFLFYFCLHKASWALLGQRYPGFAYCKRALCLWRTLSYGRQSRSDSTWSDWLFLCRSRHRFRLGPPTLSTCLRGNTCVHTYFSVFAFLVWREVGQRFVRSYLFFVPFLESGFTSPAGRRSSPLSHVSACWFTLVYLAAFALHVWHCLVSLIRSANGVHKTASKPKLGENIIIIFPKFSSLAQNHVWSESQFVTEGMQRKIPQSVCIPMFLLIQPYPGNTS